MTKGRRVRSFILDDGTGRVQYVQRLKRGKRWTIDHGHSRRLFKPFMTPWRGND